MRLVLLSIFYYLFAAPAQLLAQELPLLTFNFQQRPLNEVLAELEANYSLTFSYRVGLVENRSVSARAEMLPLPKALEILLKDLSLEAQIVRERYILLLATDTEELAQELKLQPYRIKGQVVDQAAGFGLPFARLRIKGSSEGGYTDAEGFFELSVLGQASDSVEIFSLGYQAVYYAIADLANSKKKRIAMVIASFGLADVVVTAYLTDGIQAGEEVGQVQFSPSRIDVLPGQAEPDVLQGLLLLPGISSPTESISDINIRGGTADQNLVLWDGIPVYHTGHYFGAFTAFNPFIVDKVDVWRGSYGARYSGRVAGVIDIQTKNTAAEKLSLGAGLNLTHGHFYLETPIVKNKLSWLLSIRRSFTDILPTITFNNYQAKIFQGTIIRDNEAEENDAVEVIRDRFFFVDAHSKLLWEASEKDKVVLSFFAGENELEFALGEGAYQIADNFRISNWGTRLNWTRQLRETLSLELATVYSYFDSGSGFLERIINDLDLAESAKINTLSDQRLSSYLDWQPNTESSLLFGLDWSTYDLSFNIDYVSIFDPAFQEAFRQTTDVYGAFFDYRFKDSKNRWNVQLGLRAVLASSLEEQFWEPRVNFSYRTESGLRLKANAGINHQFINQLIEFDFTGIDVNNQIWTLVDGDDFPALRSAQLAIGADWGKNGWFVDLEGYYRRLDGLTSLVPAFANVNISEYSAGESRSLGIDFLLRKRWGKHLAWISYSLSNAQYLFPEFALDWVPAFNDQRHRFSWVYTYEQERLTLSLGWNLQTGLPYSSLADVAIDEYEDEFGALDFAIAYAELGPLNANRLPTYHRLDVSALYTFPKQGQKSAEFKIGCSVSNLYNQNNLESRRYRDTYYGDDEPLVPVVDQFDKKLLPITPNLFFRVQW